MGTIGVLKSSYDIGQDAKVRLSCYLVLLSNDSKTSYNKTGAPSWPDPYQYEMLFILVTAPHVCGTTI